MQGVYETYKQNRSLGCFYRVSEPENHHFLITLVTHAVYIRV